MELAIGISVDAESRFLSDGNVPDVRLVDVRPDLEAGQVHERLFLRPELAAYESALRRRVGRLASLEDPRLVVVEALEHDSDTRRVAVISRHLSGLRLQEVLRRARERELVPDLTVLLDIDVYDHGSFVRRFVEGKRR